MKNYINIIGSILMMLPLVLKLIGINIEFDWGLFAPLVISTIGLVTVAVNRLATGIQQNGIKPLLNSLSATGSIMTWLISVIAAYGVPEESTTLIIANIMAIITSCMSLWGQINAKQTISGIFTTLLLLLVFPWSNAKAETIYEVKIDTINKNQPVKMIFVYLPVGSIETTIDLVVPGGGFLRPLIADSKKMALYLAKKGYPSASCGYSNSDYGAIISMTDQVIDIASTDVANRYKELEAQLSKYKLKKINVIGLSAGAIININAVYHRKLFSPNKVVSMWGATRNLSWFANATTPILFIHGTADKILPYGTGAAFGSNPFIGWANIIVSGGGDMYSYCLAHNVAAFLETWQGYSHGLTKPGDKVVNVNKATDQAIAFLHS